MSSFIIFKPQHKKLDMILYQSSTPNFTRSKNREHTSAKKTVDRNDFSKNSETANTTNVTATLAIGLGTEFYKKTEQKNTLN